MATVQHWPVPSPTGRDRTGSKTEVGADFAALYASVALLGISALAGAATSSLIQVLWMAGILSAGYSLAALAWGFLSLRKGFIPREAVALRVLGSAALVHLTGLTQGLWLVPEASRAFDVTLASLLILELSAIAVLGWRRNAAIRRSPGRHPQREPSAASVVGLLFAASILVAAITTVGMAASTAGELAVPHSGHGGNHETPTVPEQIQQLKEHGHHH